MGLSACAVRVTVHRRVKLEDPQIAIQAQQTQLAFDRRAPRKVFRRRDVSQQSRLFVIRVCDDASNVIETHEHAGDFKEP